MALYLFDAAGGLLDAFVDDVGKRPHVDHAVASRVFEERLASLGVVTFGDVEVAPFEVSRFGIAFGLIPRPPEEPGDAWWVEMQPGNYLAFTEPWDGDYST